TLFFNQEGEMDIRFSAVALSEAGIAKITVRASSGPLKAEKTIELDVKPSSPRIFETIKFEKTPGETVSIKVPDKGIKGTNNATINVMKRPNLNINHRIGWLIQYPYGCIEQTTSAVFPQLYLKEFLGVTEKMKKNIDNNINNAISRIVNFQTSSGGFSYWPGDSEANPWGTNYAGHFLIEAKKLGYIVPEYLIDRWLKFQKSQALAGKESLLERTYNVYLLALAGFPELGAMNQLKEGFLDTMEDREKWLLAAAYEMAGHKKTSEDILDKTGIETKDYNEFSSSFGSGLRDKALIMNCAISLNKTKIVDDLFDYLAEHLATDDWYSTQTTGYMLLSIGKHLKNVESENAKNLVLKGTVKLSDGSTETFDLQSGKFSKKLVEFGKQITVSIDKSSTVSRAYISVEWDGIPLKPEQCISERLNISARFLDDDGYPIKTEKIKQGTSFWLHLSASPGNGIYHSIHELALQFMLPSGWEIENTRLSNEQMPEWMRSMKLEREKYLDIRDDRVIWFFDMENYHSTYEFVTKINAVTPGKFTLPPIVFEAMYDNRYKACTEPKTVFVVPQ
ncbi:MAG TPA: hypothetical protein VLJ60_01300, partial [bacterium]|nr:hypothetical protein [bacterium]